MGKNDFEYAYYAYLCECIICVFLSLTIAAITSWMGHAILSYCFEVLFIFFNEHIFMFSFKMGSIFSV